MKNILVFLLVLLSFPLLAKVPQVILTPSHIAKYNGDFLKDTDAWQDAAKGAVLFKTYPVSLNPKAAWADQLDPKQLVDALKKQNLPLSFEFGDFVLGSDRLQSGANAAKRAMKDIEIIENAGGKVAALHLDGADQRLMLKRATTEALTLDEYADQMVVFWKMLKEKYPDTKLIYLVNLPNWDLTKNLRGRNGDWSKKTNQYFLDILNAVYEKLKANNLKMDGLEIDNPYNYYTQKKSRIGDANVNTPEQLRFLQKWCADRNVQYNIIINSEPKTNGKKKPDLTKEEILFGDRKYKEDCLYFIKELKQEKVTPDMFVIQSWYILPYHSLPETQESSFFNIALSCQALIQSLYGE